MVQLKVYEGLTSYFLDLYETEPIKLNLSIEDITNADAKSVFSRTFKVPNTRSNSEFFKNAFLVEGVDYDVTVKKRAEVLVDGAEFRQGHIRLQKIYHNKDQDKIDYEIIFLGETRDFSSAVGNLTLQDLDVSDLTHDLNYPSVTQSWQAYPEGNATAGLFNGDLLYPLVDHGNTYDDNGLPNEPRIAYSANHGQTDGYGFNHQQNFLLSERFKPMIRAKYLLDKIFSSVGYSYTSNFLNGDLFRKLYVSAWGNEPSVIVDGSNENIMEATTSFTQAIQWQGTSSPWVFYPSLPNEISDPGNNWNGIKDYIAPATGPYQFEVQLDGINDLLSGNGACMLSNNAGVVWPNTTQPFQGGLIEYIGVFNLFLQAGDSVRLKLESNTNNFGSPAGNKVFNARFKCIEAPGVFNPGSLLDNNYKQTDFVKDILKTFRLVMAPSKTDPKNFIIEPWNDYIATGDVYDWSDKVVNEKDIQIEPLFFTQSARINFRNEEDGDHYNVFNQLQFKETFGGLNFISGNELLVGQREIKVNWAPTPMGQIEGAGTNANFLIPQLHTHDTEDSNLIHEPIKSKTRFLFYNGLVDIIGAYNGPDPEWYYQNENTGSTEAQSQYPRVSYWSDELPTVSTQQLVWQVERGYYETYTGFDGTLGNGLFTSYWQDYIESLYNKYARRVTQYFILNNVDLQDFSFDDIVFVDGVYYRPEKVIDAQIGDQTAVKVELIKLLNYVPYIPIYGCTDPLASNYDPAANVDDGSCSYAPPPVPGCTDPSALNYDPNATVDDGSCTYASVVIDGCTDPSASNYNPNANNDDGSCVYPVYGCTDPAANNYNPNATVDDGSCSYNPGTVLGCTDIDAINYNPNATQDDGSCYFLPIDFVTGYPSVFEPPCHGDNAFVTVGFEGGNPPYTVNLTVNNVLVDTQTNVGSQQILFPNYSAGLWEWEVTDTGYNGQTPSTVNHSLIVNEPPAIVVTNTNVTGTTAEVVVTGGTPGYTISWSDGATTFTRTGLTPSTTYNYVVTDSAGCTAEGQVTTPAPKCLTLRGETLSFTPGQIRWIWFGSSNAYQAQNLVSFLSGGGSTQGQVYSIPTAWLSISNIPATGLDTDFTTQGNVNVRWFYDGQQVVVDLVGTVHSVSGSYLYDNFEYCKW